MRDRHDPSRSNSAPACIRWCDELRAPASSRRAHTVLASLRTGRRFRACTTSERDLLIVLDTMPQWQDFRLRPAEITFWHRGVEQRACPLLWGSSGDGSRGVFYDWAPATEPPEPTWLPDLREQLVLHGIGLATLSQAEFVNADRVALARLIRRHAFRPVEASERERVRRVLSRGGRLEFQAVLCGEYPGLGADTVCRLIFDGMLRLVPSDRLRPETRVELNEPLT